MVFHTLEHYWAIKRNEMLIHTITLINAENPMLNKSVIKVTYCMIPFI